MRPSRGFVWGCALAALVAVAGPAPAAWNNVFQVCCHNCGSRYAPAPPVVAAYAAPAAAACPDPCQQCTTRYVQRCYYQPVTTYKQVAYYEPVTTYRTSYYYEPVTCYRYSCYFDPCTCRYQQVAQAVTSYRLRSQCCPVTSYLQRCALQPVCSYQQVNYWEPVTTCCTTTVGAPVFTPPAGAVTAPAHSAPAPSVPPMAPAVPAGPTAPPGTSEQSTQPFVPAPGTSEGAPPGTSEGNTSRNRPFQTQEPPLRMAPADNGVNRQPQLRAPTVEPRPPQNSGSMRPDRIASRSRSGLQGQLVSRDRVPQGNVRMLFVGMDARTEQRAVTTDAQGGFLASLDSGEWLVYVQDASGRAVFQQKVRVSGDEPVRMTLVGR
jgi:hypothetical protein